MRTFNVRLVLWLIGICLIGAIGVHLLHGYQVRKNADVYRELAAREDAAARDQSRPQADRATSAGNAVGHYRRYLALRPSDVAVRADFGKLLLLAGDTNRAYQQFERVLREDPDNDEIRRLQIEMTIAIGANTDARAHLEYLISHTDKPDAELLELRGKLASQLGDLKDAAKWFKESYTADPTRVTAYRAYADLLRANADNLVDEVGTAEDGPSERITAEQVIDQMVAANPDSANAHLLRADFYWQERFFDEQHEATVKADVDKALELAPQDPGVLAYAARSKLRFGDVEAARKLLNQSIELQSDAMDRYVQLIDLEHGPGRTATDDSVSAAIAAARRGLEAIPDRAYNSTLRWRLALLLMEQESLVRQQRDARQAEMERSQHAGENVDAVSQELAQLDRQRRDIQTEVQQLQAGLEKDRPEASDVAFLKARQLFIDQKWFEALQLLDARRTDFNRLPPGFSRLAQTMRAQCYIRLGNADQQVQAYRRLREDNPMDFDVVASYAMALARLGRVADALAEYNQLDRVFEKLASRVPAEALEEARVNYFKQRFLLEMELAATKGESATQFAAAEKCVQEVARLRPEDSWVAVAQADLANNRQQPAEARAILEAAIARWPNDLLARLALFTTLISARDFDAAASLLDDIVARFPDSPRLRECRARLLVQRDGREGLAKLDDVVQGIDAVFSNAEQAQLYVSLTNLTAPLDIERAIQFGRQAARRNPNDLSIRLMLLRLARLSGNVAIAEEVTNEIQAVERGGPVTLFAQAETKFAEYIAAQRKRHEEDPNSQTPVDNSPLRDARRMLQSAEQIRPNWVELQTLMGSIDRTLRDNDSALAHYLKAIDLGSRDGSVIEAAAMLLLQQGRERESAAVLNKIREAPQPSLEVARDVSRLALQQSEFALAREMAEIPIKLNAAEAGDYVFQALIELNQGNYAAARAALEQALARDPDSEDVRLTMVRVIAAEAYQARSSGHNEEFQQLADQARAVAVEGEQKVEPAARLLFRARTAAQLERLVDPANPQATLEALQNTLSLFDQAIKANPDDAATLGAAARYYLDAPIAAIQGLAVPILERVASGEVTQDDTARANARRELARLLGRGGLYRRFQEAIVYSDDNLGRPTTPGSPPFWPEEMKLTDEQLAKATAERRDDLWVRAQILAARGLPSLQREALRILESLVTKVEDPPIAMDALMSELYLNLGDRQRGVDTLRSIIGRVSEGGQYSDLTRYIGRYIDLLLEEANISEAAEWVRRLKQAEARSKERWIHTVIREARLSVPRTIPGGDALPWQLSKALDVLKQSVDDATVLPTDRLAKLGVVIQFLENLLNDAVGNRTAAEQEQIQQEIDRYFQAMTEAAGQAVANAGTANTSAVNPPNLLLLRVPYLARQGQLAAAMELVHQHWEQASPMNLVNACSELVNVKAALRRIDASHATDAERAERKQDVLARAAEAEQILIKAANGYRAQGEAGADAVRNVLTLLAALYLDTQRYEEAISAYREILSHQPENVIALNNTALMLATTNPAQAREQIDIAMKLVGPLPTIVDSYAMILLANGEKDQALTAARRVISEQPVLLEPALNKTMAKQWGGFYFHLAAILDANGQTEKAIQAMGEALRLGVEETDVFEPELPLWHRMLEKWNAVNAAK